MILSISKDPREDFEALFRQQGNSATDDEYFYLCPGLACFECGKVIWLPYRSPPQTDEEGILLAGNDPLELPSAEWYRIFGCIHCGHVAKYVGDQVEGSTGRNDPPAGSTKNDLRQRH